LQMLLRMKASSPKKPLKVRRAEKVGVQHHRHRHLLLVQVVPVEHHHGQEPAVLRRFDQVLEVVLQFVLEVLRPLVRLLHHLHQVHRVVQVEQQLQLRRLHVRVLRNRQREFKN